MNALVTDSHQYPIIPDYGPNGGYLFALRAAIRGNVFYSVKIEREIDSSDLTRALEFQFEFSERVCINLEKRFKDNSVLSFMKILVPSLHPTHERLLKEYGIEESQQISDFYGRSKLVDDKEYGKLIDGDNFRKEFRSFKRQASMEWVRYSLGDVASTIGSNAMWKESYPNLLSICQIALVQCCSIALCERGFSTRTTIKTKWRNRLEIASLDALLKIVLEGPDIEDAEFNDSMTLWSEEAHRHIFTSSGICALVD